MIFKQELREYLNKARPVLDAARPAYPEHHWRLQPQLQALQQRLDLLDAPDWQSVRAVLETAMADASWVDAWVSGMAAEALRNPFYQPPLAPTSNAFQRGMAIFSHPYAWISLNILPVDTLADKKIHRQGPASVVFTGSVSVQKFLCAGGAVLRMWHADAAGEAFSLADAHRCHAGVQRALHDGEIISVDGRSESYVIEHASGDIVLLQAEILIDRAPLLVEYDAQAGVAIAASSNNDGASRSQMLLSFLAGLQREGDDAVVERFTHQPEFFLRWHATRELLRMNQDAALARLHAMACDDPHPDLRSAAGAALGLVAKAAQTGGGACHA